NRALLDEATVDVGPGDGEGASTPSGGVGSIARLDQGVAIQGRSWQHDLGAPREGGSKRQRNADGDAEQQAKEQARPQHHLFPSLSVAGRATSASQPRAPCRSI